MVNFSIKKTKTAVCRPYYVALILCQITTKWNTVWSKQAERSSRLDISEDHG